MLFMQETYGKTDGTTEAKYKGMYNKRRGFGGGAVPGSSGVEMNAVRAALLAKDQEFFKSPRNIVRGVYSGDGLCLRVKRGSDFGTFVEYQLLKGNQEVLHFYLDMHYPYSNNESNTSSGFKGVRRMTQVLLSCGAFMWSGHGYTDREGDYVEAEEYAIEHKYHHVSHTSCVQVVRGEWVSCNGNPDCGQKMWQLNIAQFSEDEESLQGEQLRASFTLVRFNQGEERMSIELGEDSPKWVIRTGELGSAGSLDKAKLARSGKIFARHGGKAELKINKMQNKGYVSKVFQGSEAECGSLVWVEKEEGTEERRGPLSCIIQLLHLSEGFNLRFLTEVCRDQTGAGQGSFMAELYQVLSGESSSCDAFLGTNDAGERLLCEAEWVPGLPDLTNYTNSFLSQLDLALEGCEDESIKKFVMSEFVMKTRYKAQRPCPGCKIIPAPSSLDEDLPKVVLKKTTNRNVAVDVKESILLALASQKSSIQCLEDRRCRRQGAGVTAALTVEHWPRTLHVSLEKPSPIKLTDITNPIELEPNVTYHVEGIIHQEGQRWWTSVKVGEYFFRIRQQDGRRMEVKKYAGKQETQKKAGMNIRGNVVMLVHCGAPQY